MNKREMGFWSLKDFKSIGAAQIPLAHLTILSGMNSSGKSSLIQSILFVSQSVSKDSIVLNGPLVRLGLPEDIVRDGMPSLQVGGALDLLTGEEGDETEKFSWTATLSAAATGLFEVTDYQIVDSHGSPLVSATSSRISQSDKVELQSNSNGTEFLLRVTEFGGRSAPPRTFLGLDGLVPKSFVFRRTEVEVGQSFNRIFPRHLLSGDSDTFEMFMFFLSHTRRRSPKSKNLDATRQALANLEGQVYREQRSEPLVDKLTYSEIKAEHTNLIAKSGWTRTRLHESMLEWRGDPFMRRYFIANSELQDEARLGTMARIADVVKHITVFAGSVKYIGPLREQPQVVNSSYGADHPGLPVGARGESAAHAMLDGSRKYVECVKPDGERERMLLADAVAIWASYLGLGDHVDVEDIGKLGRGLRISINDKARDLTMVGVGASQLLPIILAALSVESGSLLVIEQPELHLHPAVQSRLADFLLTARPDIRFIVETHSEYLITRLRRRIAEESVTTDQVKVFFAEQVSGTTTFKELSIDKMGNFEEWPIGFFDTQNDEARAIITAVSNRLIKIKS